MARKKEEVAAEKSAPDQKEVEKKPEPSSPEAKLVEATEDAFMRLSAEEKSKLRDQALDDVCQMIGVPREQLERLQHEREQANAMATSDQRVVDMGPYRVEINGKVYQGIMVVDKLVAEVLMETVGKKRQRILREAMKREFLAEYQAGGNFKTTLVNGV